MNYLHVMNGGAAEGVLRRTDIPGDTTPWADVLHDGPTRTGLTGPEWRAMRARYGATRGFGTSEELEQLLAEWETPLDRWRDYDEIVFWFEHDLFDQALLIRHLHWVAQSADPSRFRLICIGAFPGHPNFAGLGELNPQELATLFPTRAPISEAEITTGEQLWEAFCAGDPRPLADLVLRGDTSALPFAAGALRRHLEDFPDAQTGLSRTERQVLTAVAQGATDATGIFVALQQMEERPYLGDLLMWAIIRTLVDARTPLLSHAGEFREGRSPSGTFRLTEAGQAVLSGATDHIAINGIDRWLGGVHLTDGRWRWNSDEIMVRSP
jgi:hypothetical protein